MEGDFIKINKWLLPLSWLYGLAVKLRNAMFDIGLLRQRSFRTPVISVGNITVGGTGKTPHVEYLAALLKDTCHVAVLSRGYKRKSKGFVMAGEESTVADVGDELLQMRQKFPDVTVAADKDRCHGIDLLEDAEVQPDVILLDDAFQHRYVTPGINILLVDYHRLIIYDRLLPAGRLREPLKGKSRADIVIITKCPKDLKPMEYRVIIKAMDLYPYQQLFFTTLEYGELKPAFNTGNTLPLQQLSSWNVLLMTGIASPEQMLHDLSPMARNLTPLVFADHHRFRKKDIRRISETFAAMDSPKCIITTEKDAVRLRNADGLSPEARAALYVLPVKIKFMQDQQESFNHFITSYVLKNSRNSILAKSQDDNKSKDSHRAGNRTRTISFRNN